MQGSIKRGRIASWCGGSLCAVTAIAFAWAPTALAGSPILNTFTVNQTGDASDSALGDMPNACDVDLPIGGDQCTLRAAIEEANATAGHDKIAFNIPGDGVHTIQPATALPSILEQTTVDGLTQPGASANTQPVGKPSDAVLLIELDGINFPNDPIVHGFDIQAGGANSTIRGMVITNFAPWAGINIQAANGVTITGNYLGTNPAGTAASPNGIGVLVVGGTGNAIGGQAPADRNLISGNTRNGIISNPPLAIRGNYIGVAADGKSPLGNAEDGVHLTLSGGGQPIGGPGGAANVIAHNGENGIVMFNEHSGIPITNNRIFGNGDLGIDLSENGVTPNDEDDPDVGPNELQNFPILKSARTKPSGTKVKGELNSTPGQTFSVEFFSNKAKERQGRKPIGSKVVEADAGGDVTFGFKPAKKVKPGQFITTTATTLNQSTSEFSKPLRVTSG
jgi:CSLREA domain-containing protein